MLVLPLLPLATDPPATPYLAGMVLGFALGGFGHLIRSTPLILSGIALIAVTTLLFIIATDPHLGR